MVDSVNAPYWLTAQNWIVQWKVGSLPTIGSAVQGNDITARLFNQVKNAIGGINPTGIANKEGVADIGFEDADDIIGNDFVMLRDKLNGIN